jgi:uncharacterized OB-fold protein
MSVDRVFEQRIELSYRRTVGDAQRSFLEGLAEGRVVASADGELRIVPARPFAPDGRRLPDVVDVQARGVVVASSTAHHLPGAPVYALIRIDGTDLPMLHLLEEALPPGTSVVPMWEPSAEPGIRAIRAFQRA